MTRTGILAACVFAGFMGPAWADAPRKLSCTGAMIEPTALAKAPKTIKLTVDQKTVGVDAGDKTVDARVVSDNPIQLKFEANDLVGEYFHYTGQLFVIYPSGHLAQMTCTKE